MVRESEKMPWWSICSLCLEEGKGVPNTNFPVSSTPPQMFYCNKVVHRDTTGQSLEVSMKEDRKAGGGAWSLLTAIGSHPGLPCSVWTAGDSLLLMLRNWTKIYIQTLDLPKVGPAETSLHEQRAGVWSAINSHLWSMSLRILKRYSES